jgi:hypothetical protein
MVFWDDLGFRTNYEVEADLDYPGDDGWTHPIVLVGNELGAGPIAEIIPSDEPTWLLSAELVGVVGLYGCPDPDRLCLVERGKRAVLVRAAAPHDQLELPITPTRISAVHDPSLLLITEVETVAAFAADGSRRWRSRPIAFDLHILRTDNGRIVCRGFARDGATNVIATLDAETGAYLEDGPLFL